MKCATLRMNFPYKKASFVAGTIILFSFSLTIFAQQVQKQRAKNLQVLAKDISHEELDKQMDFYCASLSVKCNYCHAPSTSRPGKLDFASDSNAGHKEDGRRMIKLTREINEKYFGARPGEPASMGAINCYTCHRGEQFPSVPEFDSLAGHKPAIKIDFLNKGNK